MATSPTRDVVLLCSGSPRRAALLAAAGIPFEVGPVPDVDETPPVGVAVQHVALELAKRKVERAHGRAPDRVVLCADTTVILDGRILDKPCDAADARQMLRALSGRTHLVVTGVAIATPHGIMLADERASVRFRPLADDEIDAYVATGEPFGKAGGYAIQGGAAGFVSRLVGHVDTVVGLPMQTARDMLVRLEAMKDISGAHRGP